MAPFGIDMKGEEILRQHRQKLDTVTADVMPSSWKGHARLAIHQSDDLSSAEKEQALDAVENLAEKKPQHFDKFDAEKVANKVIEKLA
jgi:hypothetical protein